MSMMIKVEGCVDHRADARPQQNCFHFALDLSRRYPDLSRDISVVYKVAREFIVQCNKTSRVFIETGDTSG